MGVDADADADTGVVLAGCVGYEGELRLVVVASGLCAAEVGEGVDAALELGFVGDIDGPPAAELERAAAAPGAGPIFRGARPTGGALVDMTAAIPDAVVFLLLPLSLSVSSPSSCSSSCPVLLCFFLVGDAVGLSDRSIDRRTVSGNAHVTVGRVYWCNAPNPVGYRFIGRLWCQSRLQQRIRQGGNDELTIDDAID